MRRFILLCILTLSACALAVAQSDTVFIELTDSSTMIFPRAYIEQWDEDDTYIRLHLAGDTTLTIVKAAVLSQSDTYNRERPAFESFKFNNKFNDQLFTDAEGQIDQSTGEITASVGCIGKRLTPSFKVPEGAKAYIDGRRHGPKAGRGKGEAVSETEEFILLTTEAKWYRNNRMTGRGVPELESALGDEFIVDYVRVYDIVK